MLWRRLRPWRQRRKGKTAEVKPATGVRSEALEPRVLFSADLPWISHDGLATDSYEQSYEQAIAPSASPASTVQSAEQSERQNIVVVDPSLLESEQLSSDAVRMLFESAGYAIAQLDQAQDGIEQLGALLGSDLVGNMELLTTAGADGVRLGNGSVGVNTVLNDAGTVSSWSSHFDVSSQIRIHASELELYPDAEHFGEVLSRLTGSGVGLSAYAGLDKVAPEPVQLAQRHEVVFVDTGVEGYQALIDDLGRASDDSRFLEVILLDPDQDGVGQITQKLQSLQDLDGVHIISHGDAGVVQLGDTALSIDSLGNFEESLVSWRSALSEHADLLIYGCDLASNKDGELLIGLIADLTGADVAASDDLTGARQQGGDWDLEFADGAIEAEIAFSSALQEGWMHVLASTSETLVNQTTAAFQDSNFYGGGSIASDANGNFVVVWQDNSSGDYDVYGRLFNADGTPSSNEFLINSTVVNDQRSASVAMDADGDFIVTWSSFDQDSVNTQGVYAQRFNATGVAQGSEFQVNSKVTGDQWRSKVGVDDAGNFAIVFTDESSNSGDVFLQRYSEAGTALGAATVVNSTTASAQSYADVAVDGVSGNIVVVWESVGQDGDGTGVYARLLNSSGTPISAEIQVNQVTAGLQENAKVAFAADGGFVVAWDTGTDMSVRTFDASGAPVSAEILVNTATGGLQGTGDVSVDSDGRFIVAWASDDGLGGYSIEAQLFSAGGAKLGSQVLVSETVSGYRGDVSVAFVNGVAAFSWSGQGAGDADGVYARSVQFSNVATASDTVTTGYQTPVVIDVLANDSDAQGDALTLLEVTSGANGTTAINGDGTVTYTPDPGYLGADNFGYIAADPSLGLQHYWSLGGHAVDAIGGADGTVSGASSVAGHFGDGLGFNESSDYVQIPDVVYAPDSSISFDFKLDDNAGSLFQYLYSHGSVNDTNSISVFVNEAGHGTDPNVLRTVVRDSNDTLDNIALQVDVAALVGDGLWHNYTVTTGAAGVQVYLDGELVASDSTRGTGSIDPLGDLFLGARQDLAVDRYYGGALDSLSIYSAALTPSQIADLQSGNDRGTVSVTVENQAPTGLLVAATSAGGLSINQDGGNDVYLEADDGSEIFSGLTALTFETRYATTDATNQALASYTRSGDLDDFKLVVQPDGDLLIDIGTQQIFTSAFDFHTLADGVPHSVSFTWDNTSGDWSVYVDGTAVDSGTGLAAGYSIASGGTFVLGNEQDQPGSAFDATVAQSATLFDVRLFDNVRSASEIANSYASTVPYNEGDLLANWQFSDLSAGGIVPETVNGNNLALKHTAESGFVASVPALTLAVQENATNGAVVGQVSGVDLDRDAQIAALLSADGNLVYSEVTDKFYKVETGGVNLTDARNNAIAQTLAGQSGQLVTIRSAAEQNIVAQFAATAGTSLWLGATDATVEGEWRWQVGSSDADQFWSGDQNGSIVDGSYQNWLAGKPDSGSGDEDGASIRFEDGYWDDDRESINKGYIVEWNADAVLAAHQALSYTIDQQSVPGAFAIDANSGEITVLDASLLDYEAVATHSVDVRVTDAAGASYSETLSIALENEPDIGQRVPAAQVINEGEVLTFSSSNVPANGLSVIDTTLGADEVLRISLSVTDGYLTLSGLAGITFIDGANGSESFVVDGTESAINAALEGMTFTPYPEYSGNVSLTMVTELATDQVGGYDFASEASDGTAGTIQNGTLVGDAVIVNDVDRGQVLQLDGSGDYVEIASEFDQPANVTLAAWVNFSSTAATAGEVISISNSVALRLGDQIHGVTGFFYDGTNHQFVSADNPVNLNDDTWHHVAYSFDDVNNSQNLYIDGILVGSAALTDSINYPGWFPQTTIGSHANLAEPSFDFTGMIDDARIYNRALSADEVAALAAENSRVSDTVNVTVNAVNQAPTFLAGDGQVTNFDSSVADGASDLLLRGDGRLVLVGTANDGVGTQIALTQYTEDGSLDTSFGVNGRVSTAINSSETVAAAVLQADGSIIVVGATNDGTGRSAFTRYLADGTLDNAFGTGGHVVLDISPTSSEYLKDVVISPEGTITAVGYANVSGDEVMTVVRLNSDGSLDESLNGTGILTLDLAAGNDRANSIALQSDGKLVIGGQTGSYSAGDVAVLRLNEDGSFDTTFNGTGLFTMDVSTIASGGAYTNGDSASAIAIDQGGRIVIGGNTRLANSESLAMRLTDSGVLDTSFNGTGYHVISAGVPHEGIKDIALQADGRLVLVGSSYTSSGINDVSVIRLNDDGSLDTSFDGDGMVRQPIGSATDEASAVVVDRNGNIVVAGRTDDGQVGTHLMRFTTSGELDSRLSLVNTLDGNPTYTEGGTAVVLDADVQIYDQELSGDDNFNGATLTLMRSGGAVIDDQFTATGTLGALVQGANNLIVGGTTIGSVIQNSGGTLILSFNGNATNGLVNEAMQQIAYSNASHIPPADVQIDWSFDDGNTANSQGIGGARTALGSTTVDILAVEGSVTVSIGSPGALGLQSQSSQSLVYSEATYLSQAVALNNDGSYVLVWAGADDGDGRGVFTRSFDASGNPLGPESRVNTTTTNDQFYPSVAVDNAGNYVVVWHGEGAGDTGGVFGQRFNATGVPQGSEFLINTTTLGDQSYSSVAMAKDGTFVVVWSGSGTGDSSGVFAQRYDANGIALGSEFQINTTPADVQNNPEVSMDSAGNFVVTWSSNTQDGSGYGAYVRSFNADGFAVTGEVQVDQDTTSSQWLSQVAVNDSGNFVVVWRDDGNTNAIQAQLFNPDGSKNGSEIIVSDLASAADNYPAVQMDSAGNFIVAWQGIHDGDDYGILARQFDSSGAPLGSSFVVNSTTAGGQEYPAVSMNDSGQFVIAFTDWTSGTIESRVFGLSTTENGGTASVDVVLDAAPTADVTIAISLPDATEGLLSTSLLTFTTSNWNVAQTVTVTGVDDLLNDGDVTQLLIFDPISSTDLNYNGFDIDDLVVSNRDNNPFIDLDADDSTASGSGFSVSYVEGQGPGLIVDSDAILNDPDSTVLESILITVTNALDGADEILAANTTGTSILATYANGVLTLSGTDTVANYQQVLRTITYQNSATEPDKTNRTITFVASDGANTNEIATTTLIIQNAADLAVIAPAAASTSEDSALIFAGANLINIDDGIVPDTPLRVTLGVANGTLALASQIGISIIEGANGSGSLVIDGLESDINTALNGLSYTPNADYSGADTLTIATATSAGLLGSYGFDISADDQSAGTEYHGTLNGDAVVVSDAERGQVLSLDGSGDFVQIAGLLDQPSNVTLSGWIDARGLDTSGAVVISLGTSPALYLHSDGTLIGYYESGGVNNVIQSTESLLGSGWRHVAVTIDADSSAMALFVDGLEVQTGSATGAIEYTHSPDTYIGRAGDGLGGFDFNGLIDDARVYSRALSAQEIAALATDQTEFSQNVAITVDAQNDVPMFSVPGEAVFTEGTWGYGQNQDSLVLLDGSMILTPYDALTGESVLVKLNADGTIDTGFGDSGYADNAAIGYVQSVAEQPDGKILVSGFDSGNLFLARYHADGTLDTDFGVNGVATLSSATNDEATGIALQADGSIVVVGEFGDDSLITRFTSAGVQDTAFGTGGSVIVNLGGTFENLEAVAIQSDGSIIAVGVTSIVKLDRDGNLDLAFGTSGVLNLGASIYDVTVQTNDAFVVTGGTGTALFATRFHADGLIDSGFGSGGTVNWSTVAATGHGIVQQSDGKLVVAGFTDAYPTQWLAVRFNLDGSLDSTFGANGAWMQSSSTDFSEAHSVGLYSDGTSERIVIGGYTTRDGFDNETSATMVRLNHNGSLDTSLNTNTLDGNVTFIEGGAAVVLDEHVEIFDSELSEADDFSGATLTLLRSGGPNAEDIFTNSGTLGLLTEGGDLIVDGATIGTVVTNSSGTLSLSFNAAATQSRVNQTLSQIAYSNSSEAPIASLQIDWSFHDGDTGGEQGAGGAQQAQGSTTVNIVDVPNPANISVPAGQSVAEDTILIFSSATGNAIAVDTGSSQTPMLTTILTVTNGTLTLAGTQGITFLDGTNDGGATITIAGTEADINTALDGLQYQGDPDFYGSESLTITTGTNAAIEADLYARYEFLAGSLNDQTANGYNGTALGDPVLTPDPVRGDVLRFDGDDRVEVSNSVASLGNEVSIAAWVNLDAGQQDNVFLSIGDEFYIILDNSNPSLSMGLHVNGFTTSSLSSTNNIAGEGWNHVAATINDLTKETHLYLNGQLVRSSTYSFSDVDWSATPSPNMTIGSFSDGSSAFHGSLDDVRVYNRELTEAEIVATMGDHGYDSETVAVTVTALNDAPVINNTGNPTLTPITEDDMGNSGNTVAQILATAGLDVITDVDAGALEGIAVSGFSASSGLWQYNTGTGWVDAGTVSSSSALLLRASDSLRFQPDGTSGGSATVVFSAWDQTAGVAGTKVDASISGGATAFSDQVEVATLAISEVADAPTLDLDADDSTAAGVDFAATWTQGAGPIVIVDADAVLADVDSASLTSMAITITNLWDAAAEALSADTTGTSITANYDGATGVLMLSGNDSVAAYQQVLRTITYDNTHSAPVGVERTIEFIVSDGAAVSTLATTTVEMLTEVGVVVVTNASDLVNGDTSDIDSLLASAGGDGISLREAMLAVNNSANTANGPDVIRFDIAGVGPHVVALYSALPALTEAVVIDGSSEPDFGGTPMVVLDGSGAGAGASGLTFATGSGGSTVRGLVINQFDGYGVRVLSGSDGNTFAGNYLGVDPTGAMGQGNGAAGISISSSSNIIGGANALDRNILSGNGTYGIELDGLGTSNNQVIGNYIGTDASGMLAIANVSAGVRIDNGASNNTIGSVVAAERNLVSGNSGDGIYVTDSGTDGNRILGNFIGTDVLGTGSLGNGDRGVQVETSASNTVIGGVLAGSGNVISSNGNDGIIVSSGSIGTTIQGNFIGTDLSGALDLGNGTWGIRIAASSGNLIGGAQPGAGNTIAFNTQAGIGHGDGSQSDTSILGNSIFQNDGLGIDLNTNGVDFNDSGDGDSGANGLQNYPVLTAATTNGTDRLTISGNLNSNANTTLRVEFFASSAADTSNHGEAERYLGFTVVTTDGLGDVGFNAEIAALLSDGESVSATATVIDNPAQVGVSDLLAYGNSSEFSQNITAVLSTAPMLDLDADDSVAMGADYVSTWSEGGGAVAITDVDALLIDLDGNSMASLTVSITNLLDGAAEILAADTTGTLISASYNSSSGVLSLTGGDTVANYQQVLRTITYNNTSEDANTTTRAISFQASDGMQLSISALTQVSINTQNDGPTLINNGLSIAEGGSVVLSAAELSAQDPDNLDSALTFFVSGLSGGQFEALANPGMAITSFTQQQISDGDIQFMHDGGELAPAYSVSVDDGMLGTIPAAASIAFSNSNDAPTGSVTIDNMMPAEGDTLTVTNTLADADGLSGPVSYQWYRDGIAIADADSSTYTTAQVDVGAALSVFASYTDDQGTAESVASSATAAVSNVNDPVAGQPAVSGVAIEDQTLTADTAAILDEDGVGAFSYQWYRDGVAVVGATASTYVLADADVDNTITVAVSYVDGYGTAESTTSNASATVANVNDAPTGAVSIDRLAPTQGDTLTVSNTLADADGLSGPIAYQWYRDGLAIAGATATTYTTGQSDVGAVITAIASYTDDRGNPENVSSSATAMVANLNDAVMGLPVILGLPIEDQILSIDSSAISDEDGLGSFNYQWYRDGLAITGATSSSLVLDDVDVGANISVAVSYTDPYGTAESVASVATAAIDNVNDAVTGQPVIVGVPAEDQTLTVDVSGINDADGLGAFSYQWFRDGLAIVEATADALVLSDADVGSSVSIAVSYVDDQGTAETALSVSVGPIANVNDAPEVDAGLAFSVPENAVNGTLVGQVTATDMDPSTLLENWSIVSGNSDGIFVIDPASGEIRVADNSLLDFEVQRSHILEVTVSDGVATSTSVDVAIGLVDLNEAPVVTDDVLTTSEDTSLTINATDLLANDSDPEGVPLSLVAISQPANGLVIDQLDGTWLYQPNTNFHGTDYISYTVSDGVNQNTALLEVLVSTVNDAPLVTTPTLFTMLEDLSSVASITVVDVDGDTPTFMLTGGADASAFTIDEASGLLEFAEAPDYEIPQDADQDNLYEVVVAVSDGSGGVTEQALTIDLRNVNEAPTLEQQSLAAFSSDQSLRIGQLTATDPDNGDVLQFEIVSGDTANLFQIDSQSGEIYRSDQGTPFGLYQLGVRVTDAEGLVSDATIEVVISDAAIIGVPILDPDPYDAPNENTDNTGDAMSGSEQTSESQPAQDATSETQSEANADEEGEPRDQTAEHGANDRNIVLEGPVFSELENTQLFQADDEALNFGQLLTAANDGARESPGPDGEARSFALSVRFVFGQSDVAGFASNAESLQQQLSLSLPISAELSKALDRIAEAALAADTEVDLRVSGAVVGTVSLSAGFVIWMLRGGSLLASLLSAKPIWSDFDPLPVFADEKNDDERDHIFKG